MFGICWHIWDKYIGGPIRCVQCSVSLVYLTIYYHHYMHTHTHTPCSHHILIQSSLVRSEALCRVYCLTNTRHIDVTAAVLYKIHATLYTHYAHTHILNYICCLRVCVCAKDTRRTSNIFCLLLTQHLFNYHTRILYIFSHTCGTSKILHRLAHIPNISWWCCWQPRLSREKTHTHTTRSMRRVLLSMRWWWWYRAQRVFHPPHIDLRTHHLDNVYASK